jgi:hypothetical protein
MLKQRPLWYTQKNVGETQELSLRFPTWEKLDLTGASDLSVPIAPGTQLFPVGAGLTRFLLGALDSLSLPTTALVWFAAEGDNLEDAKGLYRATEMLLTKGEQGK